MSIVPTRAGNGAVELLTSPPLAAQRDLGTDASTYRLTRPRGIGVAARDFSHACLIRLIDFPDLPLRTGTTEPIKAGHTTTLVRTEFPVGGRTIGAAYKRVRRTTWLKRLTAFVRKNACLRNFELGLELLRRGVPTARPLAVIHPRRWQTSQDSFLATEWIEHGVNVYGHIGNVMRQPATARRTEIARAAVALGRLLGTMHAQGVAHRDLKPANLMLRVRSRHVDAFLIDLDGVTLGKQVNSRQRCRNVSRLVVSLITHCPVVTRSQYLRGLRAYLAALPDGERDWKAVWRDIAAETARRASG